MIVMMTHQAMVVTSRHASNATWPHPLFKALVPEPVPARVLVLMLVLVPVLALPTARM